MGSAEASRAWPREPEVVLGVGIDLVDVDEIEEAYARFGEQYLRRVYTERERESWRLGQKMRGAPDVRFLAACFAVKEATLKLLVGDDDPVDWRCIDVWPEEDAERLVELAGPGAELAAVRGIARLWGAVDVSRSHAIAVVFGGR